MENDSLLTKVNSQSFFNFHYKWKKDYIEQEVDSFSLLENQICFIEKAVKKNKHFITSGFLISCSLTLEKHLKSQSAFSCMLMLWNWVIKIQYHISHFIATSYQIPVLNLRSIYVVRVNIGSKGDYLLKFIFLIPKQLQKTLKLYLPNK